MADLRERFDRMREAVRPGGAARPPDDDIPVIRITPPAPRGDGGPRSLQERFLDMRRYVDSQPREAPTFGAAAGRAALNRFVGNVLGLPEEVIAGSANLPLTDIVSRLTGADTAGQARELGAEVSRTLPTTTTLQAHGEAMRRGAGATMGAALGTPQAIARGLLAPAPGPGGVGAGMLQAMPRPDPATLAPGGFGGLLEGEIESDIRMREHQPFASELGDVAGDVATLLMGRPGARGVAHGVRSVLPKAQAVRVPGAPGLTAGINRIFRSKFAGKLGKGLGKAAETGVEGAALAVLQRGDPLEVAAFAAGGQAAGSLAITGLKAGVRNLAPTVVGTMLAVHVLKQAAPGVQQNIYESLDTAVGKLLTVGGAGAFAAVIGMHRIPPALRANLEVFGDNLLSAGARAAAVTVLRDKIEAPVEHRADTDRVLQEYIRNPDVFGRTARRRIERALSSDKLSLSGEIQKLMASPEFRRRLDRMDEGKDK